MLKTHSYGRPMEQGGYYIFALVSFFFFFFARLISAVRDWMSKARMDNLKKTC